MDDKNILTKDEIEQAIDIVSLDNVFKRVLILFDFDYFSVDSDLDLIMRKLKFAFIKEPLGDQ